MSTISSSLFLKSQLALRLTQVRLAQTLGISARTAQRWGSHGAPASALVKLARLVYPHDPALAAALADHGGTTLAQLGLVATAPSPPPAPPPAPPPSPPATAIVDAVVCAAAEALDRSPREVRDAVRAAFSRAREIGLTVEAVEAALGKKASPGKSPRATGA